MIDSSAIEQLSTASRRRPGPFGPAWALLPKDQQPLVIDDDLPAYDAIERMVDSNFSQLPVRNGDNRIIGVFTWRSFGKRVNDLRKTSIKAIEHGHPPAGRNLALLSDLARRFAAFGRRCRWR